MFPRLIHTERSQRENQIDQKPMRFLSYGHRSSAIQSRRDRGVVTALLVRKVKISPSMYLAHAKTLESGTAKYPIRREICKSFTNPTGYLDVSHEKLFSGQLPTRLIVGLFDNRTHNGDRERNPFNFRHFFTGGNRHLLGRTIIRLEAAETRFCRRALRGGVRRTVRGHEQDK
jgi:hypothetical protein